MDCASIPESIAKGTSCSHDVGRYIDLLLHIL